MMIRRQDDYILRGWKGASCAVVNRTNGRAEFFSPAQFGVLLLADGKTQINEQQLSENESKLLRELLEKGVLTVCDAPSPLDPEQAYSIYNNRYVQTVLWSVTGRCNFRCRHCYMDAPAGQLGEISHEEALSFIDQMAECGIFDIALTGGETFVRQDIRDLIVHLTEKGIHISQIYTNGWLVNEQILDFLSSIGQRPEFNISFDGVGWHDWMRGVPGAEERVIRTIRLCQEKGFPTGVEACLHRKSVASLRETVRLMGSLNTHIKVGSVMNTELWKQNSEGNTLTDSEYLEEMLRYIPQFFEDGMPANLTLGAVIKLRKGSTDHKIIAEKHDGTEACLEKRMCGAARMCAYITPDGRLLPCMPMTSWPGYTQFKRIQDVGLRSGLTDGFYMNFVNGKIKELLARNEKCNRCEYKLRCGGGCRATALSQENDLYGSDPLQCLYWKNGYVDRIREVTEEAIRKYCK